MIPAANLMIHRQIIYRLKRAFGQSITYVQIIATDYNITTGKMSRYKNAIAIRRAIVLPKDIKRDFIYDLSYIAANKNFTYGAYFDHGKRVFIIDVRDIPTIQPSINDQIIFDSLTYNVAKIEHTEDRKGYILLGEIVEGI